jgi:hypothetical protein
LKAELAQTRADVALCRSANDEWAKKTDAANAAIKKMQADAEARAGQAVKFQEKAERNAEKHVAEARAITGKALEGDACAAAKALMADYLRRRK